MKKKLLLILIPLLCIAATPLYSTKVQQGLSAMMDSDGKVAIITFSDDTTQVTAAGAGSGDLLSTNNLSDVTTAQTAINNISAVAAATNEHVLTKDTGTGNAIWKAGGSGGGDYSDGGEAGGADRTIGNTDNYDFGILTNNTNRLQVQNDGNVGIGEASPSQALDLIGSFELQDTTSSTTGVIYKGADRFIHNFALAGTDGFNTFAGVNAGNFTMTGSTGAQGSYNTALGYNTFRDNTIGSYNIAHGYAALRYNTTGDYNIGQGDNALLSNTIGSYNIAQGSNALRSNTEGTYNIGQGVNALYANTIGTHNIAQGNSALRSNTEGTYNIGQGANALYSNTLGTHNIAQGVSALYSNTIGIYNIGQGVNALYANTEGDYNLAQGDSALFSNTLGSYNIAQGRNALYSNTTGIHNVAQGSNAGRRIAGGATANTTSDYCVFIGSDTDASADGVQRETVIGYNTIGKGTDTSIIGAEGANERVYLTGGMTVNNEELDVDSNIAALGLPNALFVEGSSGFVGIGTGTPGAILHVDSNAVDTTAIMSLENTGGDFEVFRDDASPEGVITGSIGDMTLDTTGGDIYIKNTGSATNTGWLQLATTGDAAEYANIYTANSSTAITVGASSTWYQVTTFTNDGPENGANGDNTSDDITISAAGDYLVTFSSSFSGGGNDECEVMVKKNNGVTDISAVYVSRKLGTGGDVGSASGVGVVTLAASDTVELWVRNLSAAANVTFTEVSLSVVQVDALGGGGAGAFSDAADPVVLNTTTKNVHIGGSASNIGKVEIDGDTDEVQLIVEGHSTQTNEIVSIQNSAGTQVAAIDNTGNISLAGSVVFSDGSVLTASHSKRFLALGVVESDTAVTVANGTVGIPITAELNGWDIIGVQANVYTKGVTGTTDIQVRRQRGASDVDVLSTKITIGDEYYASDEVVNTTNDDLATGDMLFADVDDIHSSTAPNGLSVVIIAEIP